MRLSLRFLFLLAACGVALGCRREERDYRPGMPFISAPRFADYDESAYSVSEGKRLFQAFNCNGCHSLGGGGMGPALMDDAWIYGYEPEQIFETISHGRPNGMPAFGGPEGATPGVTVAGTVPKYQRWQLAAYVRSLSGLVPRNAAPSRSDHMKNKPPENEQDPQSPVVAPPPPEMPK